MDKDSQNDGKTIENIENEIAEGEIGKAREQPDAKGAMDHRLAVLPRVDLE